MISDSDNPVSKGNRIKDTNYVHSKMAIPSGSNPFPVKSVKKPENTSSIKDGKNSIPTGTNPFPRKSGKIAVTTGTNPFPRKSGKIAVTTGTNPFPGKGGKTVETTGNNSLSEKSVKTETNPLPTGKSKVSGKKSNENIVDKMPENHENFSNHVDPNPMAVDIDEPLQVHSYFYLSNTQICLITSIKIKLLKLCFLQEPLENVIPNSSRIKGAPAAGKNLQVYMHNFKM